MQWWTLEIRAHRPSVRPSTIHASHSGRLRSSSTDMSRLIRLLSSCSPPGGGRAVWRTWYARLKCGSSTHTGRPTLPRARTAPSAGSGASTGSLPATRSRRTRRRGAPAPRSRARGDVHVRDAVLDVEEQAVERAEAIHRPTSHDSVTRAAQRLGSPDRVTPRSRGTVPEVPAPSRDRHTGHRGHPYGRIMRADANEGRRRRQRRATAGLVLAIHNLEVVYSDVVLVLRGVSLEVPDGSIVAVLGAERRRQDHPAAGHHRPAARAPRQGHQGHDRVRGPRDPARGRTGHRASRSRPGDGGPPGLRRADRRREPARRRLRPPGPRRSARVLPAGAGAVPCAGRPAAIAWRATSRAASSRCWPSGRRSWRHPKLLLLDEPTLGSGARRSSPSSARSSSTSTGRAPACCSSSRTPTWRCPSPTTATSSRRAGS